MDAEDRSSRPRALPRRLRAVAGAATVALSTVALSTVAACAPAGDRQIAGAPRSVAPVSASPAPEATGGAPAVTPSSHPVTTVVLTDDPFAVAAPDRDTWPGLLAEALEGAGGLELTTIAGEGTGFAATGRTDDTFSALVREHVVHSTQLVVLFDSDVGSADAETLFDGTAAALKVVEEQAPDGRAVVIAPLGASPDVRAAMQRAAERAPLVVTWVDPVTEGWPADPSRQQIADTLHRHLEELVTALAESGAFD